MKRSRYTEEQKIEAVKQMEVGRPARELGVTDQTLYNWRSRYSRHFRAWCEQQGIEVVHIQPREADAERLSGELQWAAEETRAQLPRLERTFASCEHCSSRP